MTLAAIPCFFLLRITGRGRQLAPLFSFLLRIAIGFGCHFIFVLRLLPMKDFTGCSEVFDCYSFYLKLIIATLSYC